MKIFKYNKMSEQELKLLCTRDTLISPKIQAQVVAIKKEVEQKGDIALKELTYKYDSVDLDSFAVSADDFLEADEKVSNRLKSAIDVAKENISKYHTTQLPQASDVRVETTPGVICWRKFMPIDTIGLYIPGGTAPLFSTVLMLGIPARLTNCPNIVCCSPPNAEGKIAPEILYTANLLGIKNVFKLGGAQAIFAMGFGTKTVPRVDKIFGPGNAYVSYAKLLISQYTSIDLLAGPSEVLVISDEQSNPSYIAADLLAQAEHGYDSQVVHVSTNQDIINKVFNEIEVQLKDLTRAKYVEKSLQNSFCVLTDNLEEAFEFSNLYAPEHLILNIANYEKYIDLVKNAGSVFCGEYSTESFGDYASGTNHTLPTSAFARSKSGLGIEDFGKWISYQEITKQGFDLLKDDVAIMAEKEELEAHRNSVAIRSKS